MEENVKQILNELKDMRVDVREMRTDVDELKDMRVDVKEMRTDIDELKDMRADVKEMRTDINELKQGQNRLEVTLAKLQKNLVDSLGLYTDKIVDHIDDKTEVLNKRVYKVETEIERLSRQ